MAHEIPLACLFLILGWCVLFALRLFQSGVWQKWCQTRHGKAEFLGCNEKANHPRWSAVKPVDASPDRWKSPKRQHHLVDKIKELLPNSNHRILIDVCCTRWIAHIDGLDRIVELSVPSSPPYRFLQQSLLHLVPVTDQYLAFAIWRII